MRIDKIVVYEGNRADRIVIHIKEFEFERTVEKGTGYNLALHTFNNVLVETKVGGVRIPWEFVNWEASDIIIAKALGISRQAVNQERERSGKDKPLEKKVRPDGVVWNFQAWALENREFCEQSTVQEILNRFRELTNTQPYLQAAYGILRTLGVNYKRSIGSMVPWKEVNWKLSNKEISKIWKVRYPYVLQTRCRLQVGPSSLSLKDGNEFEQARTEERHKAKNYDSRKPRDIKYSLEVKETK